MKHLRGLIFDFDGVLVDSERAHFEAFRRVLRDSAGFEITFEEYTEHYLAYDDYGAIRRALERHARPPERNGITDLTGAMETPEMIERLATEKKAVFTRLLPEIGFLPGAAELIRSLSAASVPLAIASGALKREIEELLSARDLRCHFHGIVAADDVRNFKPHPEPYSRALALLGRDRKGGDDADAGSADPRGVIAIEDSPAGMASARAAGLLVLGVTNSYPREKLGLAHHVVDSLDSLPLEDLDRLAERHGDSASSGQDVKV